MKNCFNVEVIITKTYEIIAKNGAEAIKKVEYLTDNETNFFLQFSKPKILGHRKVIR